MGLLAMRCVVLFVTEEDPLHDQKFSRRHQRYEARPF
jgi:hypothetical protein